MSYRPTAPHPGLRGQRFESHEEELRAVRGFPSSADYARAMRDFEVQASGAEARLSILRDELGRYERLALSPRLVPELREECARRAEHYKAELIPCFEAEAEQWRARVAEQRRDAEQAACFEARFRFDPYSDPVRDYFEQNAEAIAEGIAEAQRQADREHARTWGSLKPRSRHP